MYMGRSLWNTMVQNLQLSVETQASPVVYALAALVLSTNQFSGFQRNDIMVPLPTGSSSTDAAKGSASLARTMVVDLTMVLMWYSEESASVKLCLTALILDEFQDVLTLEARRRK